MRRAERSVLGLALAGCVLAGCDVAQVVGAWRECTPGSEQPCARGRGGCECPWARRTCGSQGRWGPCVTPRLPPAYEVCGTPSVDEDCNGRCDDGCRCAPSLTTRACYPGPPGTHDAGRCRAGEQRCETTGTFLDAACQGSVVPAAFELCGNGADDDCDGLTDEDCGAPRVVAVAVGDRVSCALAREDGRGVVACWGARASGLFGEGLDADVTRPTRVAAPDDTEAITLGAEHLCVRTASGRVLCGGSNREGQLGDGTQVQRGALAPVRAEGMGRVRALAAGRFHTCAVDEAGGVWCWGANDFGQAGAPDIRTTERAACADGGERGDGTSARRVAGVDGARDVRAGFEHTCALTAAGVFCWGREAAFRAAARGTAAATARPARVFDGWRQDDALVAGRWATCRLAADPALRPGARRVECVGDAQALVAGELREGVAGMAGGASWCVWSVAGEVRCSTGGWWTAARCLDDPAEIPALERFPTPGFALGDGVTGLGVGVGHACVVLAGRAVRCWGGADANRYGQLGIPGVRGEPDQEVRW